MDEQGLSVMVGLTPKHAVHVHITDEDQDVVACYSLGWLEAVRFASAVVSAARVCNKLSGSDFATFKIAANSSLAAASEHLHEQLYFEDEE